MGRNDVCRGGENLLIGVVAEHGEGLDKNSLVSRPFAGADEGENQTFTITSAPNLSEKQKDSEERERSAGAGWLLAWEGGGCKRGRAGRRGDGD